MKRLFLLLIFFASLLLPISGKESSYRQKKMKISNSNITATPTPTSLDNDTRLNNYLHFVLRGDDAVPAISEYYNRSPQPNQWYTDTSTELQGMAIEGFTELYNENPTFISTSEREDLLDRAKALATNLYLDNANTR